eukprot:CAMPEP_0117005862 /NCGR_PEP_ID=MMETSP0472-20121206/6303_1 /TAXON_ID=693140 ORGANISM="Tiarina fusus, Strain LIS" /NCGR_SAMPLE_ID=MMETSP0472 /ASSEMBLY_ACC=CAM_ASM_000603 /LENGTH=369 /DNA_ID=CAMNT_0004707177 /DNA_START=16 /DNA_END=1125 /DNA_ORIENTATION=+
MIVSRQRKGGFYSTIQSTRTKWIPLLRYARFVGVLGLSLLAVSRVWQLERFPKIRSQSSLELERLSRFSANAYRLCRVPPDQVLGYVCQGPEYDAFADKLAKFVTEEAPSRPDTWGTRRFPFPANSTILAVGNSITRQVFQNLPCQYPDAVISWVDRDANTTNAMRRSSFYEGTFANGAKLYLVTNHAMFYSPKWPELLGRFLGVGRLDDRSIDAIIVGRLNHYSDAYNTSFMEVMKEQTKDWDAANFETVPPPNILDFGKQYDGPIVGMSMMADWSWRDQDHIDVISQIDQLRNLTNGHRENIRRVHGRRYMPRLGECGSNTWWEVSKCVEAPEDHRCIGARGGHPDLIAWDVVEEVHDLLQSKSKGS